jgi:hypothetical protein
MYDVQKSAECNITTQFVHRTLRKTEQQTNVTKIPF